MSLWLRSLASFLAKVMSFRAKLVAWLEAAADSTVQPEASLHCAAGSLLGPLEANCARPCGFCSTLPLQHQLQD